VRPAEQARAVQRIAGERQGLTEEEAREMAREALRTETGTWETIITRALLRASRGAPAPGHVSLPRRALESLVKATQYEDDVRDARDVARHVLHQDFLRYEPARTDPEAARQLAEARSARASGDASLEADDPSPIERLAREFDRAAFKQGCGAINHDRGDCYRDAAKRMRAVAAEYLGLTEEQAGNVQSVRRRLGLTQERLGVEIGYRSETISRWENGHEAVPRVVRLALIGLIASHGENDAARRLARPGLTEEEAIRAVRAEMGSAWIDANPVMAGVVVGLLRRASRGVLAPEHREPIPDSIGPRGSSYDGAHASKRGAK
jgi:DNA-binding transcriptional regulator YiaG